MIKSNSIWKHDLLEKFQKALAELPDELDSSSSAPPSEEASIYEIYEQLAAMRAEMRKVNRRTVDALGTFGDVLDGMRDESHTVREQLLKLPQSQAKNGGGGRNLALSLINLLDRVQRMEKSALKQNQKGWLGVLSVQNNLKKQLGALSILTDHMEKLMLDMQITPIVVTIGKPFDPNTMKAAGSSDSSVKAAEGQSSTLVVTEEVLPGYTQDGQCLRAAEVILGRKIK